MSYLVRSAALTGLETLVAGKCPRLDTLLVRAGIDRACLRDPNLMISARAVGGLLEEVARETEMDDLGLQLAETRHSSNLGVLSIAVAHAATLRGAVETVCRYVRLHNEGIAVAFSEESDAVILQLDLLSREVGTIRQSIELTLAVITNLLKTNLGREFRLQMVSFVHSRPRSDRLHRRIFGCDVAFDADFNGIVFDRDLFDAPLPDADAGTLRDIGRYLEVLLSASSESWARRVEVLAHRLLPLRQCTAERIAGHLGTTRRTIHRRLLAEATSFEQIVDKVRAEMAAHYLGNDNRSLADVADLLGFADLSSFSRWFRRCFAVNARQWRRNPVMPSKFASGLGPSGRSASGLIRMRAGV